MTTFFANVFVFITLKESSVFTHIENGMQYTVESCEVTLVNFTYGKYQSFLLKVETIFLYYYYYFPFTSPRKIAKQVERIKPLL